MTRNRAAFTLIELLVVMVIMTVLAGLSITALNLVKEDSATEKTRLILSAVTNTLSLAKAETGSMPSPVEHPLAGSLAPRLAFARAGGGPVSPTGEALRGVTDLATISSDHHRVLLDSDRFVDERVPLLFGLERRSIGILGARLSTVTAYRRLPKPAAGATTLPGPYTAAAYPDETFLEAGTGDATAVKATIDYLFGFGSAWSELNKLGAVQAPPAAANAMYDRVWVDPQEPVRDRWEPGHLSDCSGSSRSGPGWVDTWKRYRLPGPAIYDAWGNEILYAVLGNGSVQLRSAGADGTFVWAPGEDRILSTMLGANEPTGDDEDGSRDNVVVGVGQ